MVHAQRPRQTRTLVAYTRNVLCLCGVLPRLGGELMSVIVERCLEIDVEIKLDDNGNAKLLISQSAVTAANRAVNQGKQCDVWCAVVCGVP